jgi:hypothetical protein
MRSRRAIRTVIVYALLGAVATVASSWAIHAVQFWRVRSTTSGTVGWVVSQNGFQTRPVVLVDSGAPPWSTHRVIPLGVQWLPNSWSGLCHRSHWEGVGWRAQHEEVITSDDPMDAAYAGTEHLTRFEAGWPMPAATHASYASSFQTQDWRRHTARTPPVSMRGGIQLAALGEPWRTPPGGVTGIVASLDRFALPLLPLWPGFLLNTAFYALLLFALVRTPRVLRRAVRRRRGRCAACGYDRAGLDPLAACPECGRGIGGPKGAGVIP